MIRMNDFCADPEALLDAQRQAFERVMRSGWYILGPELNSFETSWANMLGAAHCIGVANGLDALEIGLRAAGIQDGDEIITTPMTAFATILAIVRAGARPVLADIREGTALLDRQSVARCITPRTKGVLLVHLYGHVDDMDAWQEFCTSHQIQLFEDCAQAHLSTWKGKPAGRFGSFGAFSFYPTKNLGALGDAGALVCHDEDLASKAKQLRNYGQSERYHHPQLGMNSRLDEVQAALLLARLKWLETFTEQRRHIADLYRQHIEPRSYLQMMDKPKDRDNHCYHLFVVKTAQRTALQQHLQTKGIEALIHYPLVIHDQAPSKDLRRDPQGLRVAEAHARHCLSLPIHPHLSRADIEHIIEAVNGFRP